MVANVEEFSPEAFVDHSVPIRAEKLVVL